MVTECLDPILEELSIRFAITVSTIIKYTEGSDEARDEQRDWEKIGEEVKDEFTTHIAKNQRANHPQSFKDAHYHFK